MEDEEVSGAAGAHEAQLPVEPRLVLGARLLAVAPAQNVVADYLQNTRACGFIRFEYNINIPMYSYSIKLPMYPNGLLEFKVMRSPSSLATLCI